MRQFTIIKRNEKYLYNFINSRGQGLDTNGEDRFEIPEELLSCVQQLKLL